MLQLRRPIHLEVHFSGRMTTDLFLPSLPNRKRSTDRNTFTRQRLSLTEPAKYSVGKVPTVRQAVFLSTQGASCSHQMSTVPKRMGSIA